MKNLFMIPFKRAKKALKRIKEKSQIQLEQMVSKCSVFPRDLNGLHDQLYQDNSKMISNDFTIYEDLAEFESDSETLNSGRSVRSCYDDFDAFLNDIEKEEENIFVNIVLMNNLKLAKNDLNSDYELVTFKSS